MTRSITEAELDAQIARLGNPGDPHPEPAGVRATLEAEHGQVWNSFELARDFEVEAFSAALVVVVRRSDGLRGTLNFRHCPRFYWGFDPA